MMGIEDGLNTLIIMGVLLMAVGAFAGVLAGLLGVGGGIILVPAFFYIKTLMYGTFFTNFLRTEAFINLCYYQADFWIIYSV